MPEITAGNVQANPTLSKPVEAGLNRTLYSADIDPNLLRAPEYFVYIYSLSKQPFVVELPPHMPHVSLLASDGENPVLCLKIPHPFNQPDVDIINGRPIVRWHDARRIAMDICNPNNVSLDQNARLDPKQIISWGNSYSDKGVFWSLNAPEHLTKEEIDDAKKRREKYYRFLLTELDTKFVIDPKAAQEAINADCHAACEYFGEERPWHGHLKKTIPCPNCGETIKEGIKFHRSEALGIICVLDWQAAVKAGAKKREDVPEEYRWWTKPVFNDNTINDDEI